MSPRAEELAAALTKAGLPAGAEIRENDEGDVRLTVPGRPGGDRDLYICPGAEGTWSASFVPAGEPGVMQAIPGLGADAMARAVTGQWLGRDLLN